MGICHNFLPPRTTESVRSPRRLILDLSLMRRWLKIVRKNVYFDKATSGLICAYLPAYFAFFTVSAAVKDCSNLPLLHEGKNVSNPSLLKDLSVYLGCLCIIYPIRVRTHWMVKFPIFGLASRETQRHKSFAFSSSCSCKVT